VGGYVLGCRIALQRLMSIDCRCFAVLLERGGRWQVEVPKVGIGRCSEVLSSRVRLQTFAGPWSRVMRVD
jgi:ABC-type transporter Mla MlaB component